MQVDTEVAGALASVSELIFFILGAMTIVEVNISAAEHVRCYVTSMCATALEPSCKAW
jgi:hypothetical protein